MSIRIERADREFLDEEAGRQGVASGSALARALVERRVGELRAERLRAQIAAVNAKLEADPNADLWGEVDFIV
ncbi:MAG: hypothetical protein ACREM2_10400 [Vulcanimicrobiaceae bacterium]